MVTTKDENVHFQIKSGLDFAWKVHAEWFKLLNWKFRLFEPETKSYRRAPVKFGFMDEIHYGSNFEKEVEGGGWKDIREARDKPDPEFFMAVGS